MKLLVPSSSKVQVGGGTGSRDGQKRATATPLVPLFVCMLSAGVVSSFTVTTLSSSPSPSSFILQGPFNKNTNGPTETITDIERRNEVFQLYGLKKKGKLVSGDNYEIFDTKTKSSKPSKRRGKKNQSQRGGADEKVKVSSSLSQWAATQSFDSVATSSTSTDATYVDDADDAASTYTSFDDDTKQQTKSSNRNKNNKTKRERNMQLQKNNEAYKQKTGEIITEVKDIISSNNFDVSSLLSLLDDLISSYTYSSDSSNDGSDSSSIDDTALLKQFFKRNQKTSSDYTLAWVGSDDAICHLGTGLHKVPLARLQDIFVTLDNSISGGITVGGNADTDAMEAMANAGKKTKKKKKYMKGKAANMMNAITVMEVIRILGPFPNVRNTLQGMIEINTSNSGNSNSNSSNKVGIQEQQQQSIMKRQQQDGRGQAVQVTYNSMMDGLGKEIQAGDDGDVRSLDLTILFADEDAIVAVVPTDSDDGADGGNSIYGVNGENVLLFLKEEDLDAKLNGLRAS